MTLKPHRRLSNRRLSNRRLADHPLADRTSGRETSSPRPSGRGLADRLFAGRRRRIGAVVTAAAVVIGGGAATVAVLAAPASATASLTAATASGATRTAHRDLLARADHATVELKVKGQWVTEDLDRGRVTAVSATAITLARPDGRSVTLAIDATTRFGRLGSAGAVRVGVRATVLSEGGVARRVVQASTVAASSAADATA